MGVGFDQTYAASTDIDVPAGTYLVRAPAIVDADPVAGNLYLASVTGSPATVAAGQTSTVTVTYAGPVPGSAAVWFPNGAGATYGITASRLLVDAGLSGAPAWTLSFDAGAADTEAVAIDPSGKIWVASIPSDEGSASQVAGYTPFADGGASAPTVLDLSAGFDGGYGTESQSIAFAPDGTLWVVDSDSSELRSYPPSALQQSGAPAPSDIVDAVFVDDAGHSSLLWPYDLAFDTSGNAWVANVYSVAEFLALADGGLDPDPHTVLLNDVADGGVASSSDDESQSTGDLYEANGIAFDAQGHLWVTYYGSNEIVRLDVAGLSGVQVAAPAAVIGPTLSDGTSFQGLGYSTFDQSGNLWTFDEDLDELVGIANPESFVGRVSPAPFAVIPTPFSGDTAKFAFDPPAPGLGLFPAVGGLDGGL